MHVGERIRELRVARGLSVEKLAVQINRGSQTVFRWEWGDTSPRLDDLQAVAKEFGLSVSELLEGVDEPSAQQATGS